jgi:hypothetical protein
MVLSEKCKRVRNISRGFNKLIVILQDFIIREIIERFPLIEENLSFLNKRVY